MNILHLSDIHFGRNHYVKGEPFAQKEEILDKLIDTLASLDKGMRPDLVLVTGDIAWYGVKHDFEEAFTWFQRLKEALELKPDQFVFCPGNHDLNRNTAVDFSEDSLLISGSNGKINISECDRLYEYEQAHKLEARFQHYNFFCEQMGMQPYSYVCADGTREYSYLIGSSSFTFDSKTFIITCFNTAYLPYGKALKDDQMFLGLRQIQNLIDNNILSADTDDIFRIALFHHADRYLHPNEQCEYDQRKASLPLLLQHVDLALCGHTETGGMPVLRDYRNGGSLLSGGAAYYNDSHPNSFSLIHVEKGSLPQICSYFFDGMMWKRFTEDATMAWESSHMPIIWNDSIHERKRLGFGAKIDKKRKIVFSGYWDIQETKTPYGRIFFPNNRVNPARSMDIFSEEDPDSPGTTRTGMHHAPGLKQSTESLIRFAELNQFIADNILGAKFAVSGWFDIKTSQPVYVAPMDIPRMEASHGGKSSNLNWYLLLKEIEDFYNVQFRNPDRQPTQMEIDVANWLKIIKDSGELSLEISGIEKSFFMVHNRKEINWLYSVSQLGKPLAYRFKRKILIKLFGAEIKLGECELYFIGARPKNIQDIQRKIASWEGGDVRRIETTFPNNVEFWLLPDMYKDKYTGPKLGNLFTASFPPNEQLMLDDTIKKYIVEY